jgi:hypothetical protein
MDKGHTATVSPTLLRECARAEVFSVSNCTWVQVWCATGNSVTTTIIQAKIQVIAVKLLDFLHQQIA